MHPFPIYDEFILIASYGKTESNLEVEFALFVNFPCHQLIGLPLMPVANNHDGVGDFSCGFGEPVEIGKFGRTAA